MIKTLGLTHIHIAVEDLERAQRFYHEVFGATELFREEALVFINTPGSDDVITLHGGGEHPGESGGIVHFGFRLADPTDIDAAVEDVERAGGRLVRRGNHGPGAPFAVVRDPDGYEIELWYERVHADA